MPQIVANSQIYFNNISPTLKKCKWLKKLCTGSANDHVHQSSEVFFSGKISFFSICLPVVMRSQTGIFFFRNLDKHNSRLFSQEKWCFLTGISLIWKLMEYTNDHNPDASITLTFRIIFCNWSCREIAFKLIRTNFLWEKYTCFFN